MRSGLWVLAGVLIFTIVEKIFSGYVNADESNPQPKCVEIANCLLRKSGGKMPENQEGLTCAQNGSCAIEDLPNGCFLAGKSNEKRESQPNKIAGYLNLLANSIDNFTHGLAVAGSFLVSFRHGLLGTFAILREYFSRTLLAILILTQLFCSLFINSAWNSTWSWRLCDFITIRVQSMGRSKSATTHRWCWTTRCTGCYRRHKCH